MILKQTIEIEVYPHDLEGTYTWEEAIKTCAALGDGWRLPTNEELHLMWLNKEAIGGFADDSYWGSSETNVNYAWYKYFGNGGQSYYTKRVNIHVRPVRDVKQDEQWATKKSSTRHRDYPTH